MNTDAKFWDRAARGYAKSKIKNMDAYEATLARVAAVISPRDRVLEIGCGTGTTAMRLAHCAGQYTGADVSPGMIEIAKEKLLSDPVEGLDFTVAPALETRFDRESFDTVLAFNLLHLLEDLPTHLRRVHEVLKPGGMFISKSGCLKQMNLAIRMAIPVMQFFGKAPYVATFNAAELEQMIRDAGFAIEDSRVFDGAPNAQFIVARKL